MNMSLHCVGSAAPEASGLLSWLHELERRVVHSLQHSALSAAGFILVLFLCFGAVVLCFGSVQTHQGLSSGVYDSQKIYDLQCWHLLTIHKTPLCLNQASGPELAKMQALHRYAEALLGRPGLGPRRPLHR